MHRMSSMRVHWIRSLDCVLWQAPLLQCNLTQWRSSCAAFNVPTLREVMKWEFRGRQFKQTIKSSQWCKTFARASSLIWHNWHDTSRFLGFPHSSFLILMSESEHLVSYNSRFFLEVWWLLVVCHHVNNNNSIVATQELEQWGDQAGCKPSTYLLQ